jgi:hypothetical protein|tara:strand:- start:86 stop:277 length:192 start_codon:yes stop_codon:yes gene_type:complete
MTQRWGSCQGALISSLPMMALAMFGFDAPAAPPCRYQRCSIDLGFLYGFMDRKAATEGDWCAL